MPISFGPFAFDARHRLLRRGAAEVALPPRVLGVLELLLEKAGDIVPRQELMDRVWKDSFVTDTSLAEAISVLRQSLGDDPQAPTYIQTIHRRGYRFVAPVARDDANATAVGAPLPAAAPAIEGVRGAAVRPSIARELAPWSIAVLAAALAVATIWRLASLPAPEPPPVGRFEVRAAAGTTFDTRAPALAVAPDGGTVAWAACDRSAACGLYARPLNALDAHRLAGTDGAEAPFFSPDGRWIGFFADGKLKKVAVAGGSPVTLADAPSPGGGSWSDDGRIVFAATPAGGLLTTSDQGGEVERLTSPAYARGELRHVWPSWIDRGRAIVFTVATSPIAGAPGQLAAMRVPREIGGGSPAWQVLRGGISRAIPGGPGYLLAVTGNDVRALTFNDGTLALTGGEDTVLDDLTAASGVAQVAVGRDGTLLAVRSGAKPGPVFWSDDPAHTFDALTRLTGIALSGDGRHAAGVAVDASAADIWTVDLSTGGSSRITFGGDNVSPAWSPDGRTLMFSRRAPNGLFTLAAHGGRDVLSRLQGVPAAHLFPHSIGPDGTIAAVRTTANGHFGIVLLSTDAPARAIGADPVDDTNPALSPDGTSVAYESDETGRPEIYVQPLQGNGRQTLTTGGGADPAWSADGRTIYYRAGAALFRRPVEESASIEPMLDQPGTRVLAVSRSGRVLVQRETAQLDRALIVLGWLRELRQRVPLPVTAPR